GERQYAGACDGAASCNSLVCEAADQRQGRQYRDIRPVFVSDQSPGGRDGLPDRVNPLCTHGHSATAAAEGTKPFGDGAQGAGEWYETAHEPGDHQLAERPHAEMQNPKLETRANDRVPVWREALGHKVEIGGVNQEQPSAAEPGQVAANEHAHAVGTR